jgi:purine-binding chemotaxis protein CheW
MTEFNLEDTEIDGDESQNMYLTFEVAGETYAVNIGCVTTIVGMQHISEIPDVPGFIKGAMNLRGKVIPVMDVRLRFGLPFRTYDDRTTIIVLEIQESATGLVVDKVSDVVTILPDKVGPPPHWHGNGENGVIQGLGRLNDKVSIILDVARLLMDQEIHLDLQELEQESEEIVPA